MIYYHPFLILGVKKTKSKKTTTKTNFFKFNKNLNKIVNSAKKSCFIHDIKKKISSKPSRFFTNTALISCIKSYDDEYINIINNNDSAYITLDSDNKTLIISITGTNDITDWINNLSTDQTELTPSKDNSSLENSNILLSKMRFVRCCICNNGCWRGSLVHRGFYDSVCSIEDDIYDFISQYDFNNIDSIIFTGHSRGGAMINLLCYKMLFKFHDLLLNKKIFLITFGSPKVGDINFYKHLNKKLCQVTNNNFGNWQFQNQCDIVPSVPISTSGIGLYIHCGDIFKLNYDGISLYKVNDNITDQSFLSTILSNNGINFNSILEDHSLTSYLDIISKYFNYLDMNPDYTPINNDSLSNVLNHKRRSIINTFSPINLSDIDLKLFINNNELKKNTKNQLDDDADICI